MSGDDEHDSVEFGGGPGHRRWWLVGGVVVLVAVVVVVLVVRHQTGSQSPGPSAAVTPTVEHTPASPSLSPGPTPSTATSPTPGPTSRSSPSPKRVRISKVETSWLHARADYDVFARGDGELVRIRPATGTLTRTVLPPLDSSGPVSFVVRRGVALVHPLDFVSDYRIPDEEPARVARSIRNGGLLLPGPRPGLVWAEQILQGEDAAQPRFRLLRLDGSPTGVSVTVPAELGYTQVVSDGTGGLLISGRGGAYISHGHGLHRVTHGSVVATGPKTMVLVECDNHGRCRPVVADQTTGDRRSPPQLPGWLANGSAFGVTSPDGQTLAVASGVGDSPIITIIDLATGHTRTVSVRVHTGVPSRSSAQMAWSPDSKWLFVAAYDGSLKVVNTDDGRIWALGAAGSDVEQVAVRKAPAQRHKSLAPDSKEHVDGS